MKEGAEIVDGGLVKEYREGITPDELGEYSKIPGTLQYKLENWRREEVDRVKKVHKGFAAWLKKKKIDLREHPFGSLDRLILYGDFDGFAYGNWLFDTQTRRWIVFDP